MRHLNELDTSKYQLNLYVNFMECGSIAPENWDEWNFYKHYSYVQWKISKTKQIGLEQLLNLTNIVRIETKLSFWKDFNCSNWEFGIPWMKRTCNQNKC